MSNYVQSDLIEVFPSGFRVDNDNASKAKITSEQNLTSLKILSANKDNANRAFTDPFDSDYYIISIHGYYFRIKKLDDTGKDSIPTGLNVYALIKFRTISGVGNVLCGNGSLDKVTDETIEDITYFTGLMFEVLDSDDSIPSDEYGIKVRNSSGDLVESTISLDSTEVRNNSSSNSIAEAFTTGDFTASTINDLEIKNTDNGFSISDGTITAEVNSNTKIAKSAAVTINSALNISTDYSISIGSSTTGKATLPTNATAKLISGTYTNSATTANATANTSNTLVKRDASGNFSAGTITATLSGNASTASKWNSAKTLQITDKDGDYAGDSFTLDGSETSTINMKLPGTIHADLLGNSSSADKVNKVLKFNTDTTTIKSFDGSEEVTITKSDIGLSNVTNVATTSTIAENGTNNITSGAVYAGLALKQNANTAVSHTLNTAVGSDSNPVYIKADGTATACTNANITVGNASKLDNQASSYYATASGLKNVKDIVDAATNANTASTIVKRDASGNFIAGTITASLTGNATSADKVNKMLKVNNGTSDTKTFNGSADVSITKSDLGLGNVSNVATESTITKDSTKNITSGAVYTALAGKQATLTAGDNITIKDNTISATDTTYKEATTSTAGLMSAADKTKLDGIDDTTEEWIFGVKQSDGTVKDITKVVYASTKA